jgi:hypothetical protein
VAEPRPGPLRALLTAYGLLVWSAFGVGYGFVPLLLPPLGLWWLLSAHARYGPAP